MKYIVVLILCTRLVHAQENKPESTWQVDGDHGPYRDLEFSTNEGTWISVDVAPDGSLAFDLLGHIYTMPYEGGQATALTSGRSWNILPRFSPDGKKLAFTSDRGGSEDLWTMDRHGGGLTQISDNDDPVFQGSWSRDGRFLIATSFDDKLVSRSYRFNLYGGKNLLIDGKKGPPGRHFSQHPTKPLIFFQVQAGRFPEGGPGINTYNMQSGETKTYLERPGGAAVPLVSPDGSLMAYVHRDQFNTVLVVHDLETREERVICDSLDFGRFESGAFYGAYSNMSWHPDGEELVISFGGKIHAVSVQGTIREIPFTAPVSRRVNETLRFKLNPPDREARTRAHRWAQPTPAGILYEVLGDLYLKNGEKVQQLTDTTAHETNPVYDETLQRIIYAS